MNAEVVTYFDNFGFEHSPKEIRKFIGNKNVKSNIYRMQACDSIMCAYFCIGFIGFMLKGKRLLEYANLLSPKEYKKNDKIILRCSQQNLNKMYCSFCKKYRKCKKTKTSYIFKKH